MNNANFFAICYADIFDYPLTAKELKTWQIHYPKTKNMTGAHNFVEHNEIYFCLKKRKKLVEIRKQRELYARKKIIIAGKICSLLGYFPWIKMIALTGSLAMRNGNEDDDIDLLIVTVKNRVWMTRFFTTLFLEVLGLRRRPGENKSPDKICLNMYLDENHLGFFPKEQNLYIAHEILQTEPLINKNNTYEKYLEKNKWVSKYLPNAFRNRSFKKYGKLKKSNCYRTLRIPGDHLEKLFFNLQYWYMKKRITREKIEKQRIFFHPNSTADIVLNKFNKKITSFNF